MASQPPFFASSPPLLTPPLTPPLSPRSWRNAPAHPRHTTPTFLTSKRGFLSFETALGAGAGGVSTSMADMIDVVVVGEDE